MFIFLIGEYTSTSKFPHKEKELIRSIVAALTIKGVPDLEITQVIFNQTGKTITDRYLSTIRQQIKRESFNWYKAMREGQYEYIHEFKQRINEIMWLQRKHHEIIASDKEPTTNKQSSLAELHRLNITLSNYFSVAPSIGNDITISTISETETTTKPEDRDIIV